MRLSRGQFTKKFKLATVWRRTRRLLLNLRSVGPLRGKAFRALIIDNCEPLKDILDPRGRIAIDRPAYEEHLSPAIGDADGHASCAELILGTELPMKGTLRIHNHIERPVSGVSGVGRLRRLALQDRDDVCLAKCDFRVGLSDVVQESLVEIVRQDQHEIATTLKVRDALPLTIEGYIEQVPQAFAAFRVLSGC